jgi:hypothetical protein
VMCSSLFENKLGEARGKLPPFSAPYEEEISMI